MEEKEKYAVGDTVYGVNNYGIESTKYTVIRVTATQAVLDRHGYKLYIDHTVQARLIGDNRYSYNSTNYSKATPKLDEQYKKKLLIDYINYHKDKLLLSKMFTNELEVLKDCIEIFYERYRPAE